MKTNNKFMIFIVDDNRMFLESLEFNLRKNLKFTPEIRKYATGEDCLKDMHLKPAIIILDYLLNSEKVSAMNGIEVLKKIKMINSRTFVIMLSGQDRIDVAVDTMKYNAFDYIVKNESAFLKTQITINIILRELSLTKQLRNLKIGMVVFFALIALVSGVLLILNNMLEGGL
ncbi:MAG: response regulator [Bacteroidetes bacterium]|nr:response regulator [Bacteroidota bacterium]